MAAVLACGPAAVLSHVSAAELWGMLRSRRPSPAAARDCVSHITVSGNARQRRGIHVHRSRTLDVHQVTRRLNIPVTTPSRTLADPRRLLPQPQFAAALRQAEFLRLPIDPALESDRTRSELEARFLDLCRRHRLPKPEVNVRVGPFTVDFLWPSTGLVVEVDGWEIHGFEEDRVRDRLLKLLGYDVVRFTWRQVEHESMDVTTAVRGVLTRRAQ
jgi:very-short-patch-repair endonuclease